MRLYILDDLVCPVSGRDLCLEDASVVERDGSQVDRCARWCGLRCAPAATATPADCHKCSRLWVERGTLTDGTHRYPIRDGIPRFVQEADRGIDTGTQESFGYEWEHFDAELPEYDTEAENYFGIVPPAMLQDAVVLDAGCGMGRWSRRIAQTPLRRLYAVDFSRAVDRAARTLADQPKAHCIQADICNLPFRVGAIDFAYCLGVLHHLADPDVGMRSLAQVTHGPILVYLYYSLDNRPAFHRLLLMLVTAVRKVTSRMPKGMMFALSWIIAALIYWPLAHAAWVLDALGFAGAANQLPLSHYRRYSFRFMAGDAFDRFATPIEKRFSRQEIAAWLARYGRRAIFSERTPFWVAMGIADK